MMTVKWDRKTFSLYYIIALCGVNSLYRSTCSKTQKTHSGPAKLSSLS